MTKMTLLPTKREIDPFTEMLDVQRSFNRAFDDFFSSGSLFPRARRGGNGGEGWVPELDVQETADEYIVCAALPGVDKKDIDVEVTDGTLTLRGERKETKEEKGATYLRREQNMGMFQRTITLPSSVDSTKVKAIDKNGLLEIHLPKIEQTKAHHIRVE